MKKTSDTSQLRPSIRRELAASIVVFMFALPLGIGVAIDAEVPAEKGLITDTLGGLIVGLFANSPPQVSRPTASLSVLKILAINTSPHVEVDSPSVKGRRDIHLVGKATFLNLPILARELAKLPRFLKSSCSLCHLSSRRQS